MKKRQLKLTPYRCPICGGNGLVPDGFYATVTGHWSTTDYTPEKCRSCNGTGIVWNNEQNQPAMTAEQFEYLCNHPEIAEWSYDEWFEEQNKTNQP